MNEYPTDMSMVKQESLTMMPIEQAKHWYADFVQFSQSILKKDLDYGVIPGTPKPSLYKPGAEKLRFVYGLGVEYECVDKVTDLKTPFIDYTYKCTIKSKTGQILAQCEGSCNSLEPKYGYVWKQEHELPNGIDKGQLVSKSSGKKLSEFDFSINKSETTGQYGKPKEYWDMWRNAIDAGRAKRISKKTKAGKSMDAWELDESVVMYRVANPDAIGLKNTIMKMAQKRAFVGGILLATGASEFFTQDIEDMVPEPPIVYDEQVNYSDAEIVTESEETLQTAISKLAQCDTIDELTLLKETLPASIVNSATFKAAGLARYNEINPKHATANAR